MFTPRPKPRRPLPTSPFTPRAETPVEQFTVGDRVIHDSHGLGRVVEVDEAIAVIVDFGTVRERIVAPFPKLAKL